MQVHKQLDVNNMLLACKFIRNETPGQVFSCKFSELSQLVTLLKRRLQRRCFNVNVENFLSLQLYLKRVSGISVFLRILRNFTACNFIKNETPTEVFSCEFCKKFLRTLILQNIYEELLLPI